MTGKELANYLRCSNAIGDGPCESCTYVLVERCAEHTELPIPSDRVIGGELVWISCDYERICEDAAQMLEGLT